MNVYVGKYCPFCKMDGFDYIGLAIHYRCGYCDVLLDVDLVAAGEDAEREEKRIEEASDIPFETKYVPREKKK